MLNWYDNPDTPLYYKLIFRDQCKTQTLTAAGLSYTFTATRYTYTNNPFTGVLK